MSKAIRPFYGLFLTSMHILLLIYDYFAHVAIVDDEFAIFTKQIRHTK